MSASLENPVYPIQKNNPTANAIDSLRHSGNSETLNRAGTPTIPSLLLNSALLWFVLALRFSVFAGFGVEAGVGDAETFDRAAAQDVRFDDLVYVGFGDVAVPDGVGVNDDVGPVLALIEASRLVGADPALQTALGQLLLEEFLQAGFGGGIAAAARMACGALVSADEDVLFEFGHGAL